MGPRIGIPLRVDARGRLRPGRRTHYLDDAYARAIAEAGGVPLYLPPAAPPATLCAGLEGLLVPGGGDFLPEEPDPEEGLFDATAPEQIAFDDALLRGALERGLPVLGICYGMQLLARHFGGRLLYHIPRDRPDAGAHALSERDATHPLRVEPRSLLARILGERPDPVNSAHHQAVAEPGVGMRASGCAGDGLIEAIEGTEGEAFVLGVQWHPERMDGPHRVRLFAAFVAACAAARRG